jgi:NAD(P)H dehydrogenase (quinone)
MSKHLIIKAMHRDESFLSQGVKRLVGVLGKNGQSVEIRDLYDLEFNPVLTSSDFDTVKENNTPVDILTEQEYIIDANYIWVVFPIWWISMPAILKGYIDKVFLSGFAYRMENDYPKGLLIDKRVILINSMGMSHEDYKKDGVFKALELTIDKGIFEFSGMKVLAHKYFSSIMSADNEQKEKYYLEIEHLVNKIIKINHNKSDNERKVA